ncbi:hypothetical protein BGW80DRAFT_1464775 [Lactifluus volemus]|nr:hypothetical protein BGW80DRAFT_1464775 [Lactifluus volemus]
MAEQTQAIPPHAKKKSDYSFLGPADVVMEAMECIMLLDPDELISTPTNAFGFFSSVRMAFRRFNGTYRQLWATMGDAPNAWPPHQSMAMHALRPRALPDNGSSEAIQ